MTAPATGPRFLTNAPQIKKIRVGEIEQISILAYGIDALSFTATMKAYLSDNSTDTSTTSAIPFIKNRMTARFIAPNIVSAKSVTAFDVFIGYTTFQSETRRYIIDRSMKGITIRVAWLNLLGGIDHYTFTGIKRGNMSVTRSIFTKERPYPFFQTDKSLAVMQTDSTIEYELVSDFETEAVYLWLSEILSSPEVWLVESGTYIPIVVTAKDMQLNSEDLIQLSLTYIKSNQRLTQNG